jgi:hypothetical protein
VLEIMGKSSRASTRKANNRELKSKVFGPVESARTKRLSAKLLEIVQQSKPEAETKMEGVAAEGEGIETPNRVLACMLRLTGWLTSWGISRHRRHRTKWR